MIMDIYCGQDLDISMNICVYCHLTEILARPQLIWVITGVYSATCVCCQCSYRLEFLYTL